MTAADALVGVTRLLLDTNAVIPIIERYPADPEWTDRYRKAWSILEYAENRCIELMTSPITLTEVCMKRGADLALLREYQAFCQATEGVRFEPIYFDDVLAYRVANIGRSANLKIADSIQVAFAQAHGCEAILTNDRTLAERSPVRGIRLDDLALP